MSRTRAALRLLSWSAPVAALALVPVASADAAPLRAEVIVDAVDAPGDVKVFPRTGPTGPTAAERRSIDLRQVTVIGRPDSVRLTVRVKELLAGADFDQMVFVAMRPAAGSAATWELTAGLSVQQPGLSFAYLFLDDSGTDYETCDPLEATVLWRRASVRLDIPRRCIPEDPARIRVTTMTGFFRSDAGLWSKDTLRIPGTHLLS